MLTIGNGDVRRLLDDREREVLNAVREAYLLHAAEDTSLPHSVFLRFPDDPGNRIIGLPAYLGGAEPLAGMKWIASFPGNVAEGLERASAAIIVNSMRTAGRWLSWRGPPSPLAAPRRAPLSPPSPCRPRTAGRRVCR
ncbi:hypothetical protein LUR56_36880 [Streptomyces sp. MT29]|nr:hypothetical protein [Streptomyces sp. MT29]